MVKPVLVKEAFLVSGGMQKEFDGGRHHPWLVEKDTLTTVDTKNIMELTCANKQLCKFLSGTDQGGGEVRAMIEDLKVARRKATIFCVTNAVNHGDLPSPGQQDAASSPIRKGKSNHWKWADVMQTKRVKDTVLLGALPPLIKLQMPPLRGSTEGCHIMFVQPDCDMLKNLKIEFTQSNMQWLSESAERHRARLHKDEVKWTGRTWIASKLEDTLDIVC